MDIINSQAFLFFQLLSSTDDETYLPDEVSHFIWVIIKIEGNINFECGVHLCIVTFRSLFYFFHVWMNEWIVWSKLEAWWCILFPQPMILMTSISWQDVHRNDLGSLLGGAGYTNCYSPPQYEGKHSPSYGNHTQMSKHMASAVIALLCVYVL